MEKTPPAAVPVSPTSQPTLSLVLAAAAAAALAATSAWRLRVLFAWERTLPFARDFLPGAIASSAMSLAAYLLLLGLFLTRRARKWACALAAAWGAIVAGSSLWFWLGPGARNLWYALAFHLHLTRAVARDQAVAGPALRLARWLAVLAALLALASARAFADSPRDRLDRGILLAAAFYAAFYFLAVAIVARLVTPH